MGTYTRMVDRHVKQGECEGTRVNRAATVIVAVATIVMLGRFGSPTRTAAPNPSAHSGSRHEGRETIVPSQYWGVDPRLMRQETLHQRLCRIWIPVSTGTLFTDSTFGAYHAGHFPNGEPVGAENPIRLPQAASLYSWIRPPSRSDLRI